MVLGGMNDDRLGRCRAHVLTQAAADTVLGMNDGRVCRIYRECFFGRWAGIEAQPTIVAAAAFAGGGIYVRQPHR